METRIAKEPPVFLAGGGATGALIRAHDWSASSLGSPEGWASALKTLVGVMLMAGQPMFLAWGQKRTLIYNDGYADLLALKHPSALGRDFLEVWSEIRTDLRPIVEQAYRGEPVHMNDIELLILRKGYPEEAHFSFSYTPVLDDYGAVAGFFCPCVETTAQVLGQRRQQAAEAALRGERDRTRRVLDGMTEGFGLLDQNFRVIDINAEGLRLEARPRDEILGKTHWEAWPGTEDSELGNLYKRAMVDRMPLSIDHKYTWPDGREAWMETRGYPVDDGLALFWRDVSERKASEAAVHEAKERLRESEDRFRNMADHAAVMMWVTDPDGYCTYLNRGWYEFTGQDPEQAQGFGWLDAVHPEDRPRAETDFRDANTLRVAFRAEYRLRRADGVYRWAIDAASPRFGDAGEWLGYVGSVIDIDDRREAEDRLVQSEGRFRAAVDAVQGVLWTNNAVGEMKGPQPAWAALTGQSREEYQDYGWVKAVHPDDASPSVQAWNQAVAERKPFTFEHRVRRQIDCEWRQFSIRAIPLFAPTGEIMEWVGVHTDVTDLREIEAALRGGEARFRAMAEAMPGFVWTANAQGSLDYTSPRWSEYSGDAAGDGLGSGWADFVHEDDKLSAFAAWQASLETLQPYANEFRLRSRDGLYGWWLVRAMPVNNPDGTVRWVGSATDIDEIVAARDVLARSQFELERRVAERTAELMQTQEALRQSQKLEAMGQLTGGVAHDFNNLLTPIVGALDVLQRRGVGGEREQRLIDGALQSSERARILVQRLLAFARRQPLQSQAVDVGALVKGMADLIASTSGPGIKVFVDMDVYLSAAQADPNQIEMAVLNLSVNARDAMPNGGQLTIAAADEVVAGPHRAGLLPGAYVRISVADTGTGMDEVTAARAIEPFYSTKGIGKGTGLGLSMVHGLASQLGGSLLISSKVGLGTQIEFWLPATNNAPSSVEISAPATVPDGAALGTILLVDDEDLVRLSTADMLSETGFVVIEAASAEEALSVLRSGRNISAVVTDHLMPGMTGVDLARIVKETWPHTPVLIVSGYAEGEGIAPDLPRLSKPFRKSDLTGSLVSLIGARSQVMDHS
jgi:PAS domain S-box-containing protein